VTDAPAPAGGAKSRLVQAGEYRRSMPVGLERLYENALDWERLPHVHRAHFGSVVCRDMSAAGWRASLSTRTGDELLVDLVLDRVRRQWRVSLLHGRGAGMVLRTQVQVLGPDRVAIEVRAFVPELQPPAAGFGLRFAAAAARFWDADAAMMVERQRQIDRRIDGAGPRERERDLGSRRDLTLPTKFELGGRQFLLAEADGDLLAFPRRCPHQLGPLTGAALDGRVLTCPWHGYRFDAASGANLSGGVCSLSQLPAVRVIDGRVIVTAGHRGLADPTG
jgi:nitrite reductase/ring-hydroxylating ferredoxin subunit